MFSAILNADKLDNLIQSSTAESLALINTLTKISNSPILLKATADQNKIKMKSGIDVIKRAGVDEALKLLPEKAQIEDFSLSGMKGTFLSFHWLTTNLAGKLEALSSLLKAIRHVGFQFGFSQIKSSHELDRIPKKNAYLSLTTHLP